MSQSRYTCPSCSAALRTSAPLPPGKPLKCPKCQHPFKASAAAAESAVPRPAPKAKADSRPDQEVAREERRVAPGKGDRARGKAREDEADEYADPRAEGKSGLPKAAKHGRPKAGSGSKLTLLAVPLVLLLAAGGATALLFGLGMVGGSPTGQSGPTGPAGQARHEEKPPPPLPPAKEVLAGVWIDTDDPSSNRLYRFSPDGSVAYGLWYEEQARGTYDLDGDELVVRATEKGQAAEFKARVEVNGRDSISLHHGGPRPKHMLRRHPDCEGDPAVREGLVGRWEVTDEGPGKGVQQFGEDGSWLDLDWDSERVARQGRYRFVLPRYIQVAQRYGDKWGFEQFEVRLSGLTLTIKGRWTTNYRRVPGSGKPATAAALPPLELKERRVLKGGQGAYGSLALSPDGKTLACGGGDNRVTLVSAEDGSPLEPAQALVVPSSGSERPWAAALAFSPDGRLLAAGSGSDSGHLQFWEMPSGKDRRPLTGAVRGGVRSLVFLDNDTVVAAGGKKVRWWSVAGAPGVAVDHGQEVRHLAHCPVNRLVAVSTLEGVGLYDAASGDPKGELKDPSSLAGCAVFGKDGASLYVGGRSVSVWDLKRREVVREAERHGRLGAHALALAPDGRTAAYGTPDGALVLADVQTGKLRAALPKAHNGWVLRVLFSPDGKTLYTSSGDRTLKIWDVRVK